MIYCKTEKEEEFLYAYYAQGHSLQADFFTKSASEVNKDILEVTKNSYKEQPPQILQNIQGYFPLSKNYPTRLDLENLWDSDTIKKVYFYAIDPDTCQPIPLPAYKM